MPLLSVIGPFVECAYGPSDGHQIVLYGDSHAAQWGGALIPLAEREGLRLTVLTKSSCPTVDVLVARNGRPEDCVAWRKQALARLADLNPAVVVMVSTQNYLKGRVLAPEDPYEI